MRFYRTSSILTIKLTHNFSLQFYKSIQYIIYRFFLFKFITIFIRGIYIMNKYISFVEFRYNLTELATSCFVAQGLML